MEERRLPGETEAVWNLVRDGEVWTYRVWASPTCRKRCGPFRVPAGGADGAGGEAQGDGGGAADGELRPHQLGAGGGGGEAAWGASPLPVGGREPVLLGTGRSPPRGCLPGAGVGAQVLAALRAFLVSMLHRQGVREKKAALEAFSFNPLSALRFLGLYAV